MDIDQLVARAMAVKARAMAHAPGRKAWVGSALVARGMACCRYSGPRGEAISAQTRAAGRAARTRRPCRTARRSFCG